jgi:two-component system nitrogen regulation sensor histidine kinase NtrY
MRPEPAEPAAIRLSVREEGGIVRIAVADNGVGLPQQDRGRLTEPYVTHKPKGTGLGLAIVKKIMEDHGGSVTLDDRASHSGEAGASLGADAGVSGTVATLVLPVTQKPALLVKGADGA